MIASQNTPLHPTAVKVLRAVQATEGRATNHLEWIAAEAGVSDSTASRWLRSLHDLNLVSKMEQDWIWGDPHVYYEITEFGEVALDA